MSPYPSLSIAQEKLFFFPLIFGDYKSQTKEMQQARSKEIFLSAELQLNCSYGYYTETDIKL